MKELSLFSNEELRALNSQPLSASDRIELANKIIADAQNTIRYMYDTSEVGQMLRKTRDEMQTLIHMYRLDSISVGCAIRIPWWSLAEYLIDEASDVDTMFYKWVDSMPKKESNF